ncbi:uncharacterized protein LOC130907989 isoform X1 [Corythoichthys intestinalis]|uniref:uncharacterized protein LOC130907989 isoform X1 n=1 Tax=Corythoichthys intestinalis TaxID=161448 RepID=UPI0025A5B755|nr:uncharacterized protein LOC130907989 isoform X1 [Corythoichthys intestinalis]
MLASLLNDVYSTYFGERVGIYGWADRETLPDLRMTPPVTSCDVKRELDVNFFCFFSPTGYRHPNAKPVNIQFKGSGMDLEAQIEEISSSAKFGDLIEYTSPMGFSHWAVYDDDGHVIHFALAGYLRYLLGHFMVTSCTLWIISGSVSALLGSPSVEVGSDVDGEPGVNDGLAWQLDRGGPADVQHPHLHPIAAPGARRHPAGHHHHPPNAAGRDQGRQRRPNPDRQRPARVRAVLARGDAAAMPRPGGRGARLQCLVVQLRALCHLRAIRKIRLQPDSHQFYKRGDQVCHKSVPGHCRRQSRRRQRRPIILVGGHIRQLNSCQQFEK